jgi:hypothetical protein
MGDVKCWKWWTERRTPRRQACSSGRYPGWRERRFTFPREWTISRAVVVWQRSLARRQRSRLCIADAAMRSPSVAGAAQLDPVAARRRTGLLFPV